MMLRSVKKLKLLIGIFFLSTAITCAEPPPDVIVIMADDLGYHDLGFQGSKRVRTPHLDSLARNGVIFTDAHTTASVCSPSRAGFMTGRYQQRFGHEANSPPHGLGMDVNETTMGEAFQSIGYKTFLVGKWHLGDAEKHYPTKRGFDEFYGLREGGRKYFCKPNERHTARAIEHNGKQVIFDGFLTDRLTYEAKRMISSSKSQPYFLFLSYTAPHTPLQAKPEDLTKVKGNAYHALIQNMDDNIGRLIAYLKAQGRFENTIIWFLSDNGGMVREASNFPLSGQKGIKLEGGQRVPMVLSWPKRIPQGKKFTGLSSSMDIFPTSYLLAGGKNTFAKPLDGVNLWPYLTSEKLGNPHRCLFWKKLEGSAVRQNHWKLIESEGLPTMLFDLEKDLSESNNVASQYPHKVEELKSLYQAWHQSMMKALWIRDPQWIKKRKQMYLNYAKQPAPQRIGDLPKP